MTLLATVAQNIRETRLHKNLSQHEVASRSGISTSYISMLERGQRSPPLETLEAISKGLGVKPWDLFQAGRARTRSR